MNDSVMEDTKTSPVAAQDYEDLAECLQEFNVKRGSNSMLSEVNKSARCFSEPDLSSDTGERYWASYLTSTPAGLPLRACSDNFTPVCLGRKSMSPITRSTQRMCKAMQVIIIRGDSVSAILLWSFRNYGFM